MTVTDTADITAEASAAPNDAAGDERDSGLGGGRFWKRLRRNHLALAAGFFLLFLLSLLVLAPVITTHDPNLATKFAATLN